MHAISNIVERWYILKMDNIPSTCVLLLFLFCILFSSFFFHPVRFFALLIFTLARTFMTFLCWPCSCPHIYFFRLLLLLFVYSFVHVFIRLFTHLLAHSFVYSFVRSLSSVSTSTHTHTGHIHLFSLCYIVFGYLVYSIDIFTRLIW